MHAQILLKEGNKAKAREALEVMKTMVTSNNPDVRWSNYRAYLEAYADYYVETGQYEDAKGLYKDLSVFTEDERIKAVRAIEIAEGFEKSRGRIA